jgi:hypothetical protein
MNNKVVCIKDGYILNTNNKFCTKDKIYNIVSGKYPNINIRDDMNHMHHLNGNFLKQYFIPYITCKRIK